MESMIQPALSATLNKISLLLTRFFNDCHPDIVADVFNNGVIIFGGNALISGVSQYFS